MEERWRREGGQRADVIGNIGGGMNWSWHCLEMTIETRHMNKLELALEVADRNWHKLRYLRIHGKN